MESYFNNKSIFKLIGKWKYHILIIEIIAIIAAAVFSSSYFIKPKFKSTAIIYPSNLYTLSDESETEQMLQILRSQDIKERMFKELNLASHYGLDSLIPHFKTTLNGYYDDNVKMTKTEFESVDISVLDYDPYFARMMVDSIIKFYNDKVAEIFRIKYKEVIDVSKNDIRIKKAEIDSISARLKHIRENFGILDYKIQTKEATKQYRADPEMKKLLDNLKDKGGEYQILDSLLWRAEKDYFTLKNQYEQALSAYKKDITYCNIVSKPVPADKKSTPVRWIIVLISAIGVLFMSIVVISIIESSKKKNE